MFGFVKQSEHDELIAKFNALELRVKNLETTALLRAPNLSMEIEHVKLPGTLPWRKEKLVIERALQSKETKNIAKQQLNEEMNRVQNTVR